MSDKLSDYDATSSLFSVHDVNKIIVTINRDGTLTYGPDYNPDEAAKTFWNAMLNNNAVVALQLEAERLRAENEKLREERQELKNELAKWVHYWRDRDNQALSADNEKLRAALKFYDDDDNWRLNGPLDTNSGNFTGGPAKEVLGE